MAGGSLPSILEDVELGGAPAAGAATVPLLTVEPRENQCDPLAVVGVAALTLIGVGFIVYVAFTFAAIYKT